MKKLLLTSVLSFSAVFAASDADILGLYDQEAMKSHGLKMEIVDRKALNDGSGFEMVTLKMSQGEMAQEDIVFVKDDILVQDIVNLKTKESLKGKLQADKLTAALGEVYAKEDAKNIIKLGNDASKPTLLMLTDPNCPYCRMELGNIEESLKTNNYEIVITSLSNESAPKSAKIYEEIVTAKDDAAKIAILKKYYAEDAPEVKGVEAAEIERLRKLSDSYFGTGITGVPFIIDVKEIKK